MSLPFGTFVLKGEQCAVTALSVFFQWKAWKNYIQETPASLLVANHLSIWMVSIWIIMIMQLIGFRNSWKRAERASSNFWKSHVCSCLFYRITCAMVSRLAVTWCCYMLPSLLMLIKGAVLRRVKKPSMGSESRLYSNILFIIFCVLRVVLKSARDSRMRPNWIEQNSYWTQRMLIDSLRECSNSCCQVVVSRECETQCLSFAFS